MNTNDELFADLFAYRFALLDIYPDNEREIIIKLKVKLFDLGIPRNNINNLLLSFYNYYQIPMTAIEINNANIMIYLYNNNDSNYNNVNNNQSRLYRNIINILSNYNIILENNNEDNDENEEENILTENEFNELETVIIDNNHLSQEMECSICIDKFELEQEVIKLNCNHYFHKNCIRSHLLNYNNRCPLCRMNITEN